MKHSWLDEHRQLLSQNRHTAAVVFGLLDRLLTINSVLDLGCGIGTWMEVALKKPERTVLGVEVDAFAPQDLLVPAETIINASIGRPLDLHRRFDLVLCLETAEHIEQEFAAEIVSNCVRHSGIILFSAAVPGQGGTNHINEQPPEYWQCLFHQAGYDVVDLLRPAIWCDVGVPAWYKQNMLLFVNRQEDSILQALRAEESQTRMPLHRIHPSLFEWQAQELTRVRTDLAEQNAYSGEALSKAWRLIQKVRIEREAERAELQMIDKEHLSRQLVAAEKALAESQSDRVKLRQSVSWRVTAPLRAVGELWLLFKNRDRP
jgi:SAM-dependent methyltransferase